MVEALTTKLEMKLALGLPFSIQLQDSLALALFTIASLLPTSLLDLPSIVASPHYLPWSAQFGSSVCREYDALSYNFLLFP